MSTKAAPAASEAAAVLQGLWVEPAKPTLAGLAQLLARAEACGFLPEALWLVGQAEHGKTFLALLEAFEEIGGAWGDVALGLEQATHLLAAKDETEMETLLAVGLPFAQLAAALRVRQALSTGREHEKAGVLAARLAAAAEREAATSTAPATAGRW